MSILIFFVAYGLIALLVGGGIGFLFRRYEQRQLESVQPFRPNVRKA